MIKAVERHELITALTKPNGGYLIFFFFFHEKKNSRGIYEMTNLAISTVC